MRKAMQEIVRRMFIGGVAVLVYWVSPVDLIPDPAVLAGGLGLYDDVAITIIWMVYTGMPVIKPLLGIILGSKRVQPQIIEGKKVEK